MSASKIWFVITNFILFIYFFFIQIGLLTFSYFWWILKNSSSLPFKPQKKRNTIDSPLNPSNIFAECNPEETTVLLHWPGNIYLTHLHRESSCIITERSFSADILCAYRIVDNEKRITNMPRRKHGEHVQARTSFHSRLRARQKKDMHRKWPSFIDFHIEDHEAKRRRVMTRVGCWSACLSFAM